MKKVTISLLFILLIGVGVEFPTLTIKEVAASTKVDNINLSTSEIEDQLKAANNKLKMIQEEQAYTINEVEKLKKSVTDVQQKINAKKKEVEATEKKVKLLKMEINRLEEQIEERNEIVSSRARTLHESGGIISYINVLIGANSFEEFLDRARAVTIIMESDQAIISEHQADWDALEESQIALDNEILLLQDMLNDLKKMEGDLKTKRDEKERAIDQLIKNEEKVQAVIVKLEKERSELIANIVKKEQERNQSIDNIVKIEQEKSNSDQMKNDASKSQFIWPTIGGVISSYQGMRWGAFHKGIDIAGPSDYSILAVGNGKVTFSGWRNGYGNTIIIDHNNGYTTQYAHLASSNVKVGDTVNQGSVIGIMGSTGRSTGIHLDFEVYNNGKLLNPIDVLPRR